MKLDYEMLKTFEALSERPLDYEYERPIRAIERALRCGIAVASEPRREFIDGRWRTVITVMAATDTGSVTA
ncbi:MAG TPA: hypothetical protein VIM11_26775 [Tepidisphaeraceae bacterium]|jgi:hypothetical protein